MSLRPHVTKLTERRSYSKSRTKYSLQFISRNSTGVETCNSHMFTLFDARDYSFSKVPYFEREEEITDQSNFS